MYSPAKSSAQSVVLRLLCLNVILACSPGLSASSAEATQSLNASTASNLVKHFYSLLDINRYKEGILDPQGTVTNKALKSINIKGINSIGIGKYIEMDFEKGTTKANARAIAEDSCKKMLANPNTETYSFIIED